MDDVTAEGLRERARAQVFKEVDMDEEKPVRRVVHEQPMEDSAGVAHSLGALLLTVVLMVVSVGVVMKAMESARRSYSFYRTTQPSEFPVEICCIGLILLCALAMTFSLFGVYRGLRANVKLSVFAGLLALPINFLLLTMLSVVCWGKFGMLIGGL